MTSIYVDKSKVNSEKSFGSFESTIQTWAEVIFVSEHDEIALILII